MPVQDSIRVRETTPADQDAIADLMQLVFHYQASEEERALDARVDEAGRSLVAEDGGLVVGHTTAQSRELTVPGAVVPAAHVTAVGVAPTHRRRGLLSALMRRQLSGTAEPLAVLWASEGGIYQRFGYGSASTTIRYQVRAREVSLASPAGDSAARLRLVRPAEATAAFARVFEPLRAGRPGWSSRAPIHWEVLVADPEARRDGANELRGVLAERAGEPVGYALWRVRDATGEVRVVEAVAADPAAYAQVWGFLLGIDLVRTVTWKLAVPDEPLRHLVTDAGTLGATVADGLWVRLVDLPAALAARRYAAPVDVVLEVDDPLLERNAGRWRLTAGAKDKASCVRTTDAPDLACSVSDLGAVYLGGTSLAELVAAGRVRDLTGAVPSAAFGWERAPQSVEKF